MLVVAAVISIDAYLFLTLSDLTYNLEVRGIGVSSYTVAPDSKETEVGSSYQDFYPHQQVNITG